MKAFYEYLDYREYLRDFYAEKKSEWTSFSFQYLGRKLEMDASYVAKIFNNQRHLPVEKIQDLLGLLELKGKKADYFETLIHFGRAKSDQDSKVYFEKLVRLRSVQGYKLTAQQFKFYSKWYFTAIRAILGISQWTEEDAPEIARRLDPPLRPDQTRQALSFMLRTQLIEKDSNGYLRPTERHIRSGSRADAQLIRQFQMEMLDLAKRSLESHEPTVRDVTTLTIAIRSEALPDIRAILAEARQAIRQRIDLDSDPNQIYQLNLQLFPLTRVQE